MAGSVNGPPAETEFAEKGTNSDKNPEQHTSGAEACIDSVGFLSGIHAWPTARIEYFRSL
jgi:hypothetical protein